MGLSFSSVLEYFFPKQQKRVLMFGLDGAGKTTILYKLKLGEIINSIPTVGFNVETLNFKNVQFTVWDFTGGVAIRRKIHHYLQGCDALIFVVDSSNEKRLEEADMALTDILLCSDLDDAPILLLSNKQDVPNALTPAEVAEKIGIKKHNHAFHVQGTSAHSGIGLSEGFENLYKLLSQKSSNPSV